MLARMSPYLLLVIAASAMLFAAAMWYVYVRPVPQVSGRGIITNKTFQPAHTIKRFQGGARREIWTQEDLRIPDGYLFRLKVDGLSAPLEYWLDALAAKEYQVAQKVAVRYETRGYPLMPTRIRIVKMTRVDSQ
jgi:hypothetical protein